MGIPIPQAVGSGSNLKELMLDDAVMAVEIKWINRAMQTTSGNISHATKKLGLIRLGLRNTLAKYGIKGDSY